MNTKYRSYAFPGSVADTEWGPEFKWMDSGLVELRFRDYRNQEITIQFDEVLGLKYQNSDIGCPAEDGVVEVIDSEWLDELARLEMCDKSKYKHIIIGFNERGMMLEIVFGNMVRC